MKKGEGFGPLILSQSNAPHGVVVMGKKEEEGALRMLVALGYL